jgi:hypothetical protein
VIDLWKIYMINIANMANARATGMSGENAYTRMGNATRFTGKKLIASI